MSSGARQQNHCFDKQVANITYFRHVWFDYSSDRPDPPLTMELTGCESSSATVSFTPGNSNNDPVFNYTVFIGSSLNVISDYDSCLDADQVAFVVTGDGPYSGVVQLEPWRNYCFFVIAQNSLGRSEVNSSSKGRCTTPPTLPSANPTDVCAEQRSADELVIVWRVRIAFVMKVFP
jgi:hypothetical protein